MNQNFYQTIEKRRSFYSITKESTVSDEYLKNIVRNSLKHSPSAFNSQSAYAILLLGNHHDKLWSLTLDILEKIVSQENFKKTKDRIHSFLNGYGSVLFFENEQAVFALQKKFPSFKDNFPIWSQQSNAMLQYVVWCSFCLEGLGASLQHYNPLIDERVKEQWNVPEHYKLIAQMPFGKPINEPKEKDFQPIEDRFKVFE